VFDTGCISCSLLFLILISPLIQLSLFCVSYGIDIKDIKVYVTNLDTNPPSNAFYFTMSLCITYYLKYLNMVSTVLNLGNNNNINSCYSLQTM